MASGIERTGDLVGRAETWTIRVEDRDMAGWGSERLAMFFDALFLAGLAVRGEGLAGPLILPRTGLVIREGVRLSGMPSDAESETQ